MSMMIGIISYMPNDEKLRAKRLKAAYAQIDWLEWLFPSSSFIVMAQNYLESDYLDDERVIYMKKDKPIGAGEARNLILKLFYNTDYDWVFLLDDDTVTFPYYQYEDFIHDVANNPDKFKGIDGISAMEPEYVPFKKLNYSDPLNLTHYKFEPRELKSGSSMSIMRNINKYYGKELYFPNTDASKGEGNEDIEFLLDWVKCGFTWYKMNTWIRKSLAFHDSSIFGDVFEVKRQILLDCLDAIVEKNPELKKVNGKIVWKDYNAKYNKSQKVLYIERETPIEFEPNVIPKERKKVSRRLF